MFQGNIYIYLCCINIIIIKKIAITNGFKYIKRCTIDSLDFYGILNNTPKLLFTVNHC